MKGYKIMAEMPFLIILIYTVNMIITFLFLTHKWIALVHLNMNIYFQKVQDFLKLAAERKSQLIVIVVLLRKI